jgi:RNA polymerase sigma factor (sigma-70 family)
VGHLLAQRGAPRAWLIAILLDQVRRHRIGHAGRARLLVDPGAARPSAVPDIAEGSRVDVEAAIAGLSRRQRQSVVLYYLADLSVHEVAGVLGISEGSVKAHLSAARGKLRARMEER